MNCKIFYSRRREQLERNINAWLATHVVNVLYTQLSTVAIESDIEYILEHTLILFYYPQQVEEASDEAKDMQAMDARNTKRLLTDDEGPFGDPRTPEEIQMDIITSQSGYVYSNPFEGYSGDTDRMDTFYSGVEK
jgi:hypothetical protein